jgi:hypothetical protein
LEGLGWRIHRIWSTDWWMNAEGEIESLTTWLHALLEEETADSTQPDAPAADALTSPDEPEEASTGGEAAEDSVELDETTLAATNAQPLRVFAPASLPSGDPVQFYESRAATTLMQHLVLVVEAEGPIPEMVLFRRVARAWGLERTGSRIVERLKNQIPGDLRRTDEGGNTFYWPKDARPTDWSDCRVCDHNEASRVTSSGHCPRSVSIAGHGENAGGI